MTSPNPHVLRARRREPCHSRHDTSATTRRLQSRQPRPRALPGPASVAAASDHVRAAPILPIRPLPDSAPTHTRESSHRANAAPRCAATETDAKPSAATPRRASDHCLHATSDSTPAPSFDVALRPAHPTAAGVRRPALDLLRRLASPSRRVAPSEGPPRTTDSERFCTGHPQGSVLTRAARPPRLPPRRPQCALPRSRPAPLALARLSAPRMTPPRRHIRGLLYFSAPTILPRHVVARTHRCAFSFG